MNREPLNIHVIIRQGITWFNLETETEIVLTKIYILYFRTWLVYSNQNATFCMVTLDANSQWKW